MNILVIKQSSLGDVLHSTAAITAIKQCYPHSRITVLTNTNSVQVLQNNPHIEELIEFDYLTLKKNWPRKLGAVLGEIKRVIKLVRSQDFDLAFDLQGLFRSVLFLYFARADKKFVKGRWLGLKGFRNKDLHAIDEIGNVLLLADIPPNKAMMLTTSEADKQSLDGVLRANNVAEASVAKPYIVISPFTRWQSKNWPLEHFITLATKLESNQNQAYSVLITGTAEDRPLITQAIGESQTKIYNLAGELSLSELAELMRRSALVVSGDSFPMHLASAVSTPLLALFGPTDENKTGPLATNAKVLRVADCNKCDLPKCPRQCLNNLSLEAALTEANHLLLNNG